MRFLPKSKLVEDEQASDGGQDKCDGGAEGASGVVVVAVGVGDVRGLSVLVVVLLVLVLVVGGRRIYRPVG